MKFSQRYGYNKPSSVLKRGGLNEEGAKAICNCFDYLSSWLNKYDEKRYAKYDASYTCMEESIWCFFLNERRDDFYTDYGRHRIVATAVILDERIEWFIKFDLIEHAILSLRSINKHDGLFLKIVNDFIQMLNNTFIRLNYGYRVVEDQIVEITDDEEIRTIETALKQTTAVKTHLTGALKLLSDRSKPDYRNSIKESITAVEALCREITDETTLGAALNKLETKGVRIPSSLKSAFDKLYHYTNNEKTGIRHALMDETDVPQYDEAKFMLVACSAFINYLQGKRAKSQIK